MAPSSAKQDLTSSNQPKIKRPQARLNDMTKVTPGSIVYAVLMVGLVFSFILNSFLQVRKQVPSLYQRPRRLAH